MKDSNPFINFIKHLSTKDEKKNIEFKLMKEALHNHSKKIKSDNLLKYFSPIKKCNSTKEYSEILMQKNIYIEKISKQNNERNYKFNSPNKLFKIKKITKVENEKVIESSESSLNNYKIGLNAPLSYNELSSNNITTDNNELNKNDLNKNNKNINCNLLNEINRIESNKKEKVDKKKKIDYNIFINIDNKKLKYSNFNNKNKRNKTPKNNNSIKLKQNNNNNTITKKIFQPKANNYTNYSQIYSNKPRLKNGKIKVVDIIIDKKFNYKEKNNLVSSRKFIINEYNNIIIENKKKLNYNKNNNKIKVLTKNSSSKKLNLGIFEKILIDLKSIKSAANRNNKKIIYNFLNPEKRSEIMNENNNQGLFSKLNESKLSSGPISTDLNDINSSRISTNRIQIQDTYNLVKNCIDKKNKHFQKNYLNSNINLMKDDNNNIISEKGTNENKTKNNNKKEIRKEIYSESHSQDNIFDNEEIEKENETDKNIIINNNKNINIKKTKNINNNNYLIDIFEARKKYLINNESTQEDQKSNIYNRGQIFKAKTDLKIEKLRKKLLEKENSELTSTPKINEKSKKLSKNNIPIYERLNDIEKKKKSDIQRIKNIIIRENDIDENTINQKNGKIFDKKKFDKWLKRNNNWNKQIKNKMEKIKDKLNKEEFNNESFTFKPKIDDKSERIFNKNKILSKSPVVERLFNRSKTIIFKKEESKKNRKFTPNINKEYQISREYFNFMEEDQAELFNKLKEKIEKEEKK